MRYNSKTFFEDVRNELKKENPDLTFEHTLSEAFSFYIDMGIMPKDIREQIEPVISKTTG